MKLLILLMILCSCEYLPPRTAYKAAKGHSDLNIKKSFKVLDFTEKYSFTGEGLINIVFQLSDSEVEEVENSCKKNSYRKISTENLINDGFLQENPDFGMSLYDRNIREITNGYYRFTVRDIDKFDYEITILDISKKELIIYVSLP